MKKATKKAAEHQNGGGVAMATRRNPPSRLRAVPPPPPPTKQEEFLQMVDRQDTPNRKRMLLFVMQLCDDIYRKKGRAGWNGDIRKLRKDMAALEHELATVPHIGGR